VWNQTVTLAGTLTVRHCLLTMQDEEGKVLLTFPEPMKGFRDFLYFDEELQISIGNRGSLTIIQQGK